MTYTKLCSHDTGLLCFRMLAVYCYRTSNKLSARFYSKQPVISGGLSVDADNDFRAQIVESIPKGISFSDAPDNKLLSTFDCWKLLISLAKREINICAFYWTLADADCPQPTFHDGLEQGEIISVELQKAIKNGVAVNVVQDAGGPDKRRQRNGDNFLIGAASQENANLRYLNFKKYRAVSKGVLHTKMITVDGLHFYLGSANMDWRALSQIKETGIMVLNSEPLAMDLTSIFNVYWWLAAGNANEASSIANITQQRNIDSFSNCKIPHRISICDRSYEVYIAGSPPDFNQPGRDSELDALLNVIESANEYIHIEMMTYLPIHRLSRNRKRLWPVIENALRAAVIERNVKVRMLMGWWRYSSQDSILFLNALNALHNYDAGGTDKHPRGFLQVRTFQVPSTREQLSIPFSRVNHSKFVVTDNAALISTSNWRPEYFITTAGVSVVFKENTKSRASGEKHIVTDAAAFRSDPVEQLRNVFWRDWDSEFAHKLTSEYGL